MFHSLLETARLARFLLQHPDQTKWPMGPVRIHHRSHHFATQSSHAVYRAGWQAKMAFIELWIPWRNAHNCHKQGFITQCLYNRSQSSGKTLTDSVIVTALVSVYHWYEGWAPLVQEDFKLLTVTHNAPFALFLYCSLTGVSEQRASLPWSVCSRSLLMYERLWETFTLLADNSIG